MLSDKSPRESAENDKPNSNQQNVPNDSLIKNLFS